MTIKINEDVLCDYCEELNDGIKRGTCEGSCCDDASEKFLEDNGISESPPACFKNLKIGDSVYIIEDEAIHLPKIKKINIKNLESEGDTRYVRSHPYGKKIPQHYLNNTNYENWFLVKKDCEKKLEELCVEKIIELSKIIGSVSE